MLKLKLQYFGYLMQRANTLGKILMLEKIEGRRRGEQQRWLDGITDSMDMLLLLLLSHLSRVQLFVTAYAATDQAPPSLDSPGKNTGVGCHSFSNS